MGDLFVNVTLDALPYIDGPLKAGVRGQIEALIDQEMQAFEPDDYLGQLPFNELPAVSSALQAEMERIERGGAHPGLDTARYNILPPPESAQGDMGQWAKCIANANAQLQHQDLRRENLALLQEHGKDAWLGVNRTLGQMNEKLEQDIAETTKSIDQINAFRKNKQKRAASEIFTAQQQWSEGCARNVELQIELAKLEREVKRARKVGV